MTTQVDSGAATSVGTVRRTNEDNWLVTEFVYAVADGMGGHAAGAVASGIATQVLSSIGGSNCTANGIVRAISQANTEILLQAARNPAQAGMGTTITGLCLSADGHEWLGFNVGDSRVYELSRDGMRQLSIDHSEVQELMDAGMISPAEALTHPSRNIITRSLGTTPAPEVDLWTMPAIGVHTFLICSDGLTNELSDKEISEILRGSANPQGAADDLVRRAEIAGGRDNITVVVVRSVNTTTAVDEVDQDTLPRPVGQGA